MPDKEALQETLLELERARAREAQRRLEADWLMEGLSALAAEGDSASLFDTLSKLLQNFIGFEDAFVLKAEAGNSLYQSIHSTHASLADNTWCVDGMLPRLHRGEIVNIFNTAFHPAWQNQDKNLSTPISSALYVPFYMDGELRIFVCVHRQAAFFTKQQAQFMRRFSPLLTQALFKLEARALQDRQQVLEDAHQLLRENYQLQHALNTLLHRSLQDKSPSVLAQEALRILGNAPFPLHEQGAGFFLRNDEKKDQLALVAGEANLPLRLNLDAHGRIMSPPGDVPAFIQPVRLQNQTLGAFLLYPQHLPLENRHATFLDSLAEVMAGAIHRQQSAGEAEKARQLAETAAQTKARFLANMSHEIRTPLNGVLGMLELLQDTELSPTQIDYLNTAQYSAYLLLEIINDILDFSKIEAGRMDLEKISVDLHEILEEAVGMLSNRAYSKGLELACVIDAGVPREIVGDPTRLRQILINLLNNAVKFTDTGEVELSASLLRQHNGIATVEFRVRDTGIGLSEAAQTQLFQPFTQASVATNRKYGGTGLGLAICKQLVELMGGKLALQSHEGQGSIFYFQISLQITAAAEDCDFSSLSVLVVNSCALMRKVLSTYLQAWRCPHRFVSNEADILAALARETTAGKTTVVILGRDSSANIRLVRACRSQAYSPVFILLGTGGPEEKAARILGIEHFLSRPLRRTQLQQLLRDLKDGSRRRNTRPLTAPPSFNARVLLVEDNPVNQKVSALLLRKLGLMVDIAQHGGEALEYLRDNRYALVLMDCEMPEMDGYEATRRIRANENGSAQHVPIIALTAHALADDRVRCTAAGMDDYLPKPFDSEQLQTVLRQWLPC
jgi:signal transduction histidine kinase/CheY-like chemotaxis protein